MANEGLNLRVSIEADTERLAQEVARDLKRLEKETVTALLDLLGRDWESKIELCDGVLVDGVPAPILDGWRFWAPEGRHGGLRAWAFEMNGRYPRPADWYVVDRLADLDGMFPGDWDRDQ